MYLKAHKVSMKELDLKREANLILSNFGPDNRTNTRKKYVEQRFVDLALGFTGVVNRALSLTGPDVVRHARMYFDQLVNELHVVEINPFVFSFMMTQAMKCKEFREGSLRLMQTPVQICQVRNCQVVDLDLMDSLKSTRDIIIGSLDQQSETVKGRKIFIFTASIRKSGTAELRFQQCRDIFKHLGANLTGVDGVRDTFPNGNWFGKSIKLEPKGKAKYCKQRFMNFSEKGRIHDVEFYHYSDGCPMLSACIAYE